MDELTYDVLELLKEDYFSIQEIADILDEEYQIIDTLIYRLMLEGKIVSRLKITFSKFGMYYRYDFDAE